MGQLLAILFLVGFAGLSRVAAQESVVLPPDIAAQLQRAIRQTPNHVPSVVIGLIARRPDLRVAVVSEAKRLAPYAAPAVDQAVARAFPMFGLAVATEEPQSQAYRPALPRQTVPQRASKTRRPDHAHDWSMEVELGGNRSTGNTETEALRIAAALDDHYGHWEHHYAVTFDYAEDNNTASAQRLTALVRTRLLLTDHFWAFGHADYEDDRFSSFDYRFTESLGLGYRLIDLPDLTFSIEAGPGARQTKLAAANDTETELIGRLQTDAHWQISESAALSNVSSVVIGPERTTTKSVTSLTFKIIDAMSARLGFEFRHDSDVEVGQENTDTLTTATLVYGF